MIGTQEQIEVYMDAFTRKQGSISTQDQNRIYNQKSNNMSSQRQNNTYMRGQANIPTQKQNSTYTRGKASMPTQKQNSTYMQRQGNMPMRNQNNKKERGDFGVMIEDNLFDDMPGVKVENIKDVSVAPEILLERMKFESGHRYRVSVVSNKCITIKTHYSEKTGTILCHKESGGQCCKIMSEGSKVKYLLPVVVYETNSKGEVLNPADLKVSCKVLPLPPTKFSELQSSASISLPNGELFGYDIIIDCNKDTFKSLNLNIISNKNALWLDNENVKNQVRDFWKDNKGDIVRAVARDLNDEELVAELMKKGVNIPNYNQGNQNNRASQQNNTRNQNGYSQNYQNNQGTVNYANDFPPSFDNNMSFDDDNMTPFN